MKYLQTFEQFITEKYEHIFEAKSESEKIEQRLNKLISGAKKISTGTQPNEFTEDVIANYLSGKRGIDTYERALDILKSQKEQNIYGKKVSFPSELTADDSKSLKLLIKQQELGIMWYTGLSKLASLAKSGKHDEITKAIPKMLKIVDTSDKVLDELKKTSKSSDFSTYTTFTPYYIDYFS